MKKPLVFLFILFMILCLYACSDSYKCDGCRDSLEWEEVYYQNDGLTLCKGCCRTVIKLLLEDCEDFLIDVLEQEDRTIVLTEDIAELYALGRLDSFHGKDSIGSQISDEELNDYWNYEILVEYLVEKYSRFIDY